MKQGKKQMPRTSIQDVLLDEVKEQRKDSQEIRDILTEAVTTLRDIKEQTTKTNGRVNRLEEQVNFHRGGIVVAYIIIVLVAIPVLIAWIK